MKREAAALHKQSETEEIKILYAVPCFHVQRCTNAVKGRKERKNNG